MKKLLNTLYVMTPGAYLCKEGETVKVLVEREFRLALPIHTLGSIVCFGQINYSPQLVEHCAENGVCISHLNENGRFLARVQGRVSGNVLLRREQYRRADDPAASARLAWPMVQAKIANARTVLQRAVRDYPGEGSAVLERGAERLRGSLRRVRAEIPLAELRGIEGEAANTYFDVFDRLIRNPARDFRFSGRNRRPPLDATNCLLSFAYTLLMHDIRSALEARGLDPAVGFLHRDRPGRMGLALDMMEEFRPWLADRFCLTLMNNSQVKPAGFTTAETGAVTMDEETRKTVVSAWQRRKQEEITHPFLKERMAIGLIFHVQAGLLARHLRGDMDTYPPFFWR